jgi:hypothetical protein
VDKGGESTRKFFREPPVSSSVPFGDKERNKSMPEEEPVGGHEERYPVKKFPPPEVHEGGVVGLLLSECTRSNVFVLPVLTQRDPPSRRLLVSVGGI